MRITLIILLLVITGCTNRITMTGKQYPPVAENEVKILFREKPKCNYEELAFITTPPKDDQNEAINNARRKAASIGADYLLIDKVMGNDIGAISVSALAYKCGKVNRDKVDVRVREK